MPKVSICIPTYRQVDFLRSTLKSVLEQEFKDYELIINDDSPDDSVLNLLTEFSFGSRLRYFKNPINLGSPENWNNAISKANGELIKVLHHDDKFSHIGALQEFVTLMDENPDADFGFCSSKVFDLVTNKFREHRPNDMQLQMLSDMPELLFLGNLIGAPSATIYRRNLINLNYDKQLKWLVDIDFYIRALQKNNRFAYAAETLIITPTNAEHQVTECCKNNADIVLMEHLILYDKNSSQLASRPEVVNYWLGIFGRYGIYSVSDIENFDSFSESQKKIISEMLLVFHKRPLLKFIYFLYWQLDAPPFIKATLRAIVRFSYNFFSCIRNF
ncbi:glycosyltransferase family 2 protein [Methylotenera mobilis]|uniref:Glycosyl transferase family 2 n=1 Tax=Methylotenera mobilis (strain JLW8 / ATCC BAA-1282 / DSM 17540) TaxID=583345 RepID=C6WVJ3_METML|nr:glycosyltransferase family 2 protein [Methylotenera mobilis]ACT47942.1 glycosyl transferase family 2 [Methylotenera mobilis JLW8]